MKEFEVTFRIRNNLLKQRRLALGFSCAELADRAGIDYSSYCALEAMTKSPLCKRKLGAPGLVWREMVVRLADFHKCLPEDLFPEAVLSVTSPKIVKEVGAEELCPLLSSQQDGVVGALLERNPEDAMSVVETSRAIDAALLSLPPRHRNILREHLSGKTMRTIAAEQDISLERVRQIIGKCVHMLRSKSHPQHAALKEAYDA